MFPKLTGKEKPAGNSLFFLFCVPRDSNDFHAVAEGRKNRINHVGSRDKHDVAQVDGHPQIMVTERMVLLWIQHLEKSGRGVPAEIHSHFIHFVQHKNRIVRSGLLEALNDSTRKRPNVGPPVTTDFCFVADPAKTHPNKFTAERPGDGFAQGRFPHAGGAHETQNRSFHFFFQFPNGEVLQNAFLDLLEIIMVVVKHRRRCLDIQIIG